MTLAENVVAATNVPVDEATIISPGYPPTIGGVESHVHRLADALVHRGMPISVMAATDVRELIGRRVCDRVSVDYVPALSIRSMSVSPALLWRAGELRRGDALVHVHSYHALSGLAVCLVGNGPVVFTPHYHGTGHTGLARALHAPYRLLGRRIFDRADVVICVSEVERDLVHADFPQTVGKTKVIPNGVDLAEIEAAQLLPEQLPTVLCVGRLEAYKNVADVVAALARVDGPAQLVIIGDGPEREAIAAAAVEGGGRVRVLGPLSRDEVCAWLRTAHVVVSLSEHEAFGMTALEGAAAGAHVLLSDIPAHREISVKYLGAQATLLNTRHPDVVADHLTRLLSAPRPIRAAEVPDWGTVADDTADVYARARSAARRRATARPARVGLVDRAWIDHAFGVVAGPLTLPPVTEMRRALVDFMMEHPNHPIACTLDLATLTWVPVAPDRREHHAAQVIREMPPEPGADAMDILQSAAAITRPPYLPFHLLCFTDVVYLGATHMFCDGASGSVLVLALVLGDARILAGMEQRVDMRALLRAGRHGVRDHGSTWVGYALRLRRQHQTLGSLADDTAASADAVSPVGQITERKSRVVGTVVDAPAYAEFDRIRQAHHADVSIAAMLSSAVYRALVAERVPVISRGMYTLVDIRRYLDRDHRFAFGNGAKSIFLDADLHDPAALHAALRTSLESVRPVPASILGAVMAARRQQHPANESTNAESGQRILTMSAMPHLPYLDKSSGVPWVEGSVPRVVGMGSSADANSIDVFSIRTGDRLEVSVTVAPGDPYADRIERAVARLTDPASLFIDEMFGRS